MATAEVGREQRRAIHVAHAVAVGQEHGIELPALGDLSHLDEGLEIHHRFGEGILVAPAAEMAADQVGNRDNVHHRVRSSKVFAGSAPLQWRIFLRGSRSS
jgi:hypothetical protein